MAKVSPTSNRLRVLRSRSRLTQQEMAKLMRLDHTTVNKHESGLRGLDEDLIKRYAQVFKVETYEIFVDPDDLPASVTAPIALDV